MDGLSVHGMLAVLAFLILMSAFFSGSETGVMAINRYRLQHLVRQGKRGAKRLQQLLHRPDRLLGVILIGNTFANILASAVATVLAVRLFGEFGLVVVTIGLTLVVLIFAEVMPKTLAALHADRVALAVAVPLKILLKLLYPLVWLVNGIANAALRLFGVKVGHQQLDVLSREELRGLVKSVGRIPTDDQHMIMGVLDLEKMSVNDSMVPRNEIVGIDLAEPWEVVLQQIRSATREYQLVYQHSLDDVVGVLARATVVELLLDGCLNKNTLRQQVEPVHYIPEGASLRVQLLNFQRHKYQIGVVVDEYGDVQGMITLDDILEEIVGEFVVDDEDAERDIRVLKDGSVLVAGQCSVREVNRSMGWELPTEGPNTISGMVIEHLEVIPEAKVGLRIAGYPIEIVELDDNKVAKIRVLVQQYQAEHE